ncbi:autotransporter domain-containing protein [Photobacterium carnosum]|uniref:autotransporter domain-containing protein n=1 Tax=Photobacterium carnosum TaxID=2023717 RepID=UPI001E485855|nr:autotransporter domain-containing protein [Photobacterium carnosum]MCD9530911.1 autotransporter domain-containing protein [Photobacterium carnosum]MCD9542284.1 autotransporter domain-containing protein [Photobacterium carnosum]MCF2154756.1 autotransporter domain-containing protein [Photobacterium carnosum]MCF2216694.1 autotransporter domain-containing protein [Photobacterium carnosum]
MISNINQPIDLSSLNNITITENTSNSKYGKTTSYTGSEILNNATILPGGKLAITEKVIANNTIAKGTTDRASGKGAYFYISGNAKSNNATIGDNAYLNVGDVRKQEYKNGHWIFKPLSDQLTKNKAYAIKTHLLKGGVLWTGINSITKNTINNGGILNEYYGSVSGSINTNRGREYTFSPVISSNSTFNHSYDYVGLRDKKGGIQNNVSAEKNSVINVTNDGTINNIKSIDSTINSSNKGTINNIDSQHSIINVKNGGIASHIIATENSIINNENIIKNSNTLTNSTLNMDTKSKADTVILNNSLININGTSTISNIISNNDSNTISFTKKAPITLNSNTITGNYTVKMSSNLDTFSTDLINVKHQIKGNLKLDFNGLGKTGRNTIGNGIKVINNESQSSSQHVTMAKPINRGMLVYNLKNINNDYYLQSSLNKINYVNVYTPLALSNYSLSNTGSLYQRQGAFIDPNKNNIWVKYNSKKQNVNDGQLSSNTLTLGYTFYNNNHSQKHVDSGLMLNLGKLDFSYNGETNNTDAISLYNYTTIKKTNYYFDFVNGFGLYKSKINPSISTNSESFDSKIFTSSIETGYFFKYHKFNIIPQTQLIYQNYNQNSYNLVGYESDTKMDTVKQNNIIGRVGVNINRDFKEKYLYQPFIQLSVYNKFNKSHNITATDINVSQFATIKDEKTWLNVTAGINVKVSQKANIYADVIYDHNNINELIAYRYNF